MNFSLLEQVQEMLANGLLDGVTQSVSDYHPVTRCVILRWGEGECVYITQCLHDVPAHVGLLSGRIIYSVLPDEKYTDLEQLKTRLIALLHGVVECTEYREELNPVFV